MASAMQLYAGFALLVIAIIAIIVLAALVSNLIGDGAAPIQEDWTASRSATRASRSGESARFAPDATDLAGSATRHVGRAALMRLEIGVSKLSVKQGFVAAAPVSPAFAL